jgi:hypothetical protein
MVAKNCLVFPIYLQSFVHDSGPLCFSFWWLSKSKSRSNEPNRVLLMLALPKPKPGIGKLGEAHPDVLPAASRSFA